jgi:hypothetical protein
MERRLCSRCMSLAVLLLVLCGPGLCTAWGQGRGTATIAWVRGTVRDETGAPIAGAKVYARATFQSAIRMAGVLRTAIANEQGEYVIHGPGGLSSFSASLVAHALGHPPALSWFSFPDTFHFDGLFDRPPPTSRWAEIDLVVPRRGGAIEVLVLKDGKPLPSASVALRLEGADPFDMWGMSSESDELKALYDICRPNSQTGADGVAKFENVSPGLYSILAIEGPWRQRGLAWANEYQDWRLRSETRPYGHSQHVAVRAGEVSSHQVSVFPHVCAATFDVVRDGKPWKKLERLDMGMAMSSGERVIYGTRVGGAQSDVYRFETGIAPVCFANATRGRTSPRTFPFFSADGVIAVSPRLSNSLPIRLVADVSRGGEIHVRIEDADGKPVAGKARFRAVKHGGHGIDSGERDIAAEGTVIAGFEPATGWVQGSIPGRSRLLLSEKFGRVPTTDELVGRSEILPQPFVAENNRPGEVTLREERIGYLRGRIKPPTDRKVSDYRVQIGPLEYRKGAGIYHDLATGEFVAGPYRTGSTVLKVYPDRGFRPLLFRSVDVRAGEVTDVDIAISDDAERMAPEVRLLTARVVLDDGTTSAGLARLGYYSPGERDARGICMVDTGGTTRSRYWWENDDVDFAAELPGTPQGEVAVAWAPGRCGAAIVPFPEQLDEPLIIKLPSPISLRGKVIVEGDGETVTNGTLTVRAQYQGRGKLDDWLSVETTAGADGMFELAGLTPGKYRVQAVMDGIWLSASTEFTAGDQRPEPIRLTIQAPGGPVLVRVSGQQDGSPVKLRVDRPAGPLHDRHWPKFLTADGAGVVRVPALEAGKHVIRIGDRTKVVEVQSLAESKGRPVEVDFNVD